MKNDTPDPKAPAQPASPGEQRPKNGRPPRDNARKSTKIRQREIATAALTLAGKYGLGKLTTAAIARAVGIAEGTIFRHFDNKEAIVLAAIDQLDELLLASLPSPEGDPIARLGAFFKTRVALVSTHPGVARLLFSDELGREVGELGLTAVREVQARSVGFVRGCLEEAHARDMLRPELKPADLVLVVQGAALALVNFGHLLAADTDADARAAQVWQTLETMMKR